MNNKGFSLIELLVTIAISTIVLAMISIMLVQGTNLFKSENEDIEIQNEIQIVRNQLSEILMGAKSIVVVEAGEDVVIFTGQVNEANNRLVAETSGAGGTSAVTTERIITYDASEQQLYIASAYGASTSEGNLISDCITDFDISVNADCLKTVGEGEDAEQYYVNPLSVDITMEVVSGNEESEVNISARVRNILNEVIYYETDDLSTLLINAAHKNRIPVK